MGRKLRSETIEPGHPCHIVTRGNNRRRLFSYPYERLEFFRILGAALDDTRCRLHVICLMTNHVHLLLTPPSVSAASDLMKVALQRYAQRRNNRRGGDGKLFDQRYFSVAIRDEAQLAATQMYIESNPLRPAIVEDLADFPWSSYPIHACLDTGKVPANLLSPTTWYLSLGDTAAERAVAYRRAFAAYLERGEPPRHAEYLDIYEAASHPYARRLRRPDGSSAREPLRLPMTFPPREYTRQKST